MEVAHLHGYLLVKLDGAHIVVTHADATLADGAPGAEAAGDASEPPARVDCVLVSDAFSALQPEALAVCARATGRIYATEPMLALIRAELDEWQAAAAVREPARRADADAEDAADAEADADADDASGPAYGAATRALLPLFARVRAKLSGVVYGQQLQVGPLLVVARAAGGVMGAAHWAVRRREAGCAAEGEEEGACGGDALTLLGPLGEGADSPHARAVHAPAADARALRSATGAVVLPSSRAAVAAAAPFESPRGSAPGAAAGSDAQRLSAPPRHALEAAAPLPAPPPSARPPPPPSALSALVEATCAALRLPPCAGLDPLVVVTLAHGLLAELVEAVGGALAYPRAHGLPLEATGCALVLISAGAPALLSFAAAAPEWTSARRGAAALAPAPLLPWAQWRQSSRLVLCASWAGAAPFVRECARAAVRCVVVCAAQLAAAAPARPAAGCAWLVLAADADAARAARSAPLARAGAARFAPALACCAAERRLSAADALALLARAGARPAHLLLPLRGRGGAADAAAAADGGDGDGGARAAAAAAAAAARACGLRAAVRVLPRGGAAVALPMAPASRRAILSLAAARSLSALRAPADGGGGGDGGGCGDGVACAYANASLRFGGRESDAALGTDDALPVLAVGARHAADASAPAQRGDARGDGDGGGDGDGDGDSLLWGPPPEPQRVVGALERLGFDAECFALASGVGVGGGGGGGVGGGGGGASAAVREVRLLGQYTGAKLVLTADSTHVVVDGRLGISAGAALVARRTLREVVLGELLRAGPA
jgi:hypothetical protein